MTTPEEAIQALTIANKGELSDDVKTLVTHAVCDPLVRIWPEVTGHERAVVGVATQISELLDIMCMVPTDDGAEPKFNALLAWQAMHAALGQLRSGMPDDANLAQPEKEATLIAAELRNRYRRYQELKPDELVGMCVVNGHKIPIVKL